MSKDRELINISGGLSRRKFLNSLPAAAALLWVGCGGSQGRESSLESTTPTVSSKKELEVTPKTETTVSGEAILDLGNWQLAVTGWEEALKAPSGFQPGPGEKLVIVRGIARNISTQVADWAGDFRSGEKGYQFYLAGPGSFGAIPPETGILQVGALNDPKYDASLGFFVPPGFGVPSVFKFFVSQTAKDYALGVRSKESGGNVSLKLVKRGGIVKNLALIGPEAQVKDFGQEWSYPHNVRMSLNPVRIKARGNQQEQQIVFKIAESSPATTFHILAISAGHVLAYLKDGRVIGGRDAALLSEADHPLTGERKGLRIYSSTIGLSIPPGRSGLLPGELYEIFDLKGTVVMVIVGSRWGAWRLP